MVKRTTKRVAAKKPVAKKTCRSTVAKKQATNVAKKTTTSAKKPAAKKTANDRKLYVVDRQGKVYGHI